MAKKHEEDRVEHRTSIPGGKSSSAYEHARAVPEPVKQSCKEVKPRQDPGNQGKFHRGAARVWNKVRPRATRSG